MKEEYRRAIEQAAWASGAIVVGINERSLKDFDDLSVLDVGILNKADLEDTESIFKSELNRMLPSCQPFSVCICSFNRIDKDDVILYEDGKWVYEDVLTSGREFTSKYRPALEQVAWQLRIPFLYARDDDVSNPSDSMRIIIGIYRKSMLETTRDKLLELLAEELQNDQPFSVDVVPVSEKPHDSVLLCKDGDWVYGG